MALSANDTYRSDSDSLPRVLATPVGRRAMLAWGARGALGIVDRAGNRSALAVLGALSGCYRAPGTARDQLIFFSEEKELQFGLSAYREVLRQARLSENPEINEQIQRVGRKIADVANKPEYQWEFAVIEDDKMVNAFCLTRGKSRRVYRHSETHEDRRRIGDRDGA